MPYAINSLDGSRVYYESDTELGIPVIVHGGFLDPVEVVRQAPIVLALQQVPGLRLILVDHRGHGRSDKPHDRAAYALPRRVADATAVLDSLGLDRAHFLGISWGGRLGFGIGEYAPNRVRSLVLIGQHPYAINPDGPLAQLVGTALTQGTRPSIVPLVAAFESVVGRYPEPIRRHYLAADAAAMVAAWQAVLVEGAISSHLRDWQLPCLICVASEDVDFYEAARRAAIEIPGATFVAIPHADHLGVDTADVDPLLPAVLGYLQAGYVPEGHETQGSTA